MGGKKRTKYSPLQEFIENHDRKLPQRMAVHNRFANLVESNYDSSTIDLEKEQYGDQQSRAAMEEKKVGNSSTSAKWVPIAKESQREATVNKPLNGEQGVKRGVPVAGKTEENKRVAATQGTDANEAEKNGNKGRFQEESSDVSESEDDGSSDSNTKNDMEEDGDEEDEVSRRDLNSLPDAVPKNRRIVFSSDDSAEDDFEADIGKVNKNVNGVEFLSSPSISKTLGSMDSYGIDVDSGAVTSQIRDKQNNAKSASNVYDKLPQRTSEVPVKANAFGVGLGTASQPSSTTWASMFKDNRSSLQGFKLEDYGQREEEEIALEDEDLDDVAQTFGYTLIGYVAGKPTGKQAIIQLCNSWNVKHALHFHSSGWLVIKFDNEKDRDEVLGRGPFYIFGRPLLLKCMPEHFDFSKHEINNVPVWIQLPNLPLSAWNVKALGKITSRIGKPIQTDKLTSTKERVSFARVLVEIDVTKAQKKQVSVRLPKNVRFEQQIVYEYVPQFCSKCNAIGHSDDNCRYKKGATPGDNRGNEKFAVSLQGSDRPRSNKGANSSQGLVADASAVATVTKETDNEQLQSAVDEIQVQREKEIESQSKGCKNLQSAAARKLDVGKNQSEVTLQPGKASEKQAARGQSSRVSAANKSDNVQPRSSIVEQQVQPANGPNCQASTAPQLEQPKGVKVRKGNVSKSSKNDGKRVDIQPSNRRKPGED